jgi:hypothetical protein
MQKTDTTVGKLVQMIGDGELQLPEMQRRYVWPATRVRDLLDSLYRGYPSGGILVWETQLQAPTREMAVQQQSSPFMGHKLLLDGQQRLTSMFSILKGEPVTVRGRKRPIEILFNLEHPEGPPTEVLEIESDDVSLLENGESNPDTDLEEEQDDTKVTLAERLANRTFVVSSLSLAAIPTWINVSRVFSDEATDWQLLKPLGITPENPLWEKYTRRLALVRRIRDYPYVMQILDSSLSYEEVAEIFVRVNSLGAKLRGSDLALAQITARWKNLLPLLEEFSDECENVSQFTIDTGLLVRAMVVFATGQCRFKAVNNIPLAELQKAWEDAKEAIRFSLDFLKANAGVEDESLLSSPFLILLPAYYGHMRHERLAKGEEQELRRWLYAAHARGHYSRGASESLLDVDLNAVRSGEGPARLLDILLQQFGRLNVMPGDFAGRGIRSPLFSLAYIALKQKGAKDWWNGLNLSLSRQGRNHLIQYHHVFPKSRLAKMEYESSEVNEIANMAFISAKVNRALSNKPPSDYLPVIIKERGEAVIRDQLIPEDAELWKMEAFREFLEARRALLADAVNELLA